jgi:hypothetical protein
MQNTSRCREKMEGRIGRRRTYKCRGCGKKFQEDRLGPLPIEERICDDCRAKKQQEVLNNPGETTVQRLMDEWYWAKRDGKLPADKIYTRIIHRHGQEYQATVTKMLGEDDFNISVRRVENERHA